MKKILVTGGAGYVGAPLVKKLLEAGHSVCVLDLFLYEKDPFREIKDKRFLEVVKGDIRNTNILDSVTYGIDTVINLACISNDPSFDLDPKLGRSINLDAFEPLVRASIGGGARRFINASSSSVYGVSELKNVVETSPCNPLTDYSRFKLETENILRSYDSFNFTTCSVRSATVCGYSPRQRLDVIVNLLTAHAYYKNKITVEGGAQKRPNVHIDDITDFYVALVDADKDMIAGQSYNYGGTNYTVKKIAEKVKKKVDKIYNRKCQIEYKNVVDARSYHISSSKAWHELQMAPKKDIDHAIGDIIQAFEDCKIHHPMTNVRYYNIKRLRHLLKMQDHSTYKQGPLSEGLRT